MIRRWVPLIVALPFLLLQNGQARQLAGYLKSSGVRWENQVLHGEVKNVPVARLIEDLMRDEHFDCSASGALPGTISMRFDGLTVEESIRKIMRTNHYSFSLVLHPASAGNDADPQQVHELRIYQGIDVVRFAKTQRPAASRPAIAAAAAPPVMGPRPAATGRAAKALTDAAATDRQQLDREIILLMEELLSQQKVTREEYDQAMREMDLPTNKQKEKIHEKDQDH